MLEETAHGTYLLRENSVGELRLSVRRNTAEVKGAISSVPKVGHIPISKRQDNRGWMMGPDLFESLDELIAFKMDEEGPYQLNYEYASLAS